MLNIWKGALLKQNTVEGQIYQVKFSVRNAAVVPRYAIIELHENTMNQILSPVNSKNGENMRTAREARP